MEKGVQTFAHLKILSKLIFAIKSHEIGKRYIQTYIFVGIRKKFTNFSVVLIDLFQVHRIALNHFYGIN